MKKTILILVIVFVAGFSGNAQEGAFGKKTEIGFQIAQYQNDFGIGVNLSSPYFAKKRLAVRLRGNLVWNQHLNSESVTVWSPYSNLSLGIVGVAREIGDFLRLYGEGGMIILFPSGDFSTKSFQNGGYGLFGFEFFMDRNSNYYIEIGGIGTGAVADKIAGKPIY